MAPRLIAGFLLLLDLLLLWDAAYHFENREGPLANLTYREWFALVLISIVAMIVSWGLVEVVLLSRRIRSIEQSYIARTPAPPAPQDPGKLADEVARLAQE